MQTTSPSSPDWSSLLRSPRFLLLFIPLLWAICYLPALGTRDLRLEEGRRATPALEMVRSGNFITPTLYGQPYLNKPPLFFYSAAAISALQGHLNELSVRLPSALSTLFGALLLLFFARKQLPLEIRALSALLFLTLACCLDKGTLGEIDAALSFLAFAALALWWEAYDLEKNRLPLWGWLASGFLLGLSALMKGPGGPLQFYAVLIPFLLLSRPIKIKVLLAPAHLLMILLTLAPVTLWVYLVLLDTHLTVHSLVTLWSNQMHLETITAGKAPDRFSSLLSEHYLPFVPRVFLMLLPWSIPAIFASFPKLLRPSEQIKPVWLLCAVSGPALVAFFWFWPTGNPRYLMMLAYPLSTLAALFIASPRLQTLKPTYLQFLRSTAFILAILTLLLAVASVIASVIIFPPTEISTVTEVSTLSATATSSMTAAEIIFSPTFFWTLIIAAISGIIAFFIFIYTRRTPLESSPSTAAISLALLILLGRGTISSVFLPYQSTHDAIRIMHNQIIQLVPPDRPVYTTLTFRSARGDDYYNPQFYLPASRQNPVRGIDNLQNLPPNQTVTLLLRPDQWPALLALAPDSQKLGELSAPKGPPPVWVAKVTRPPATTPSAQVTPSKTPIPEIRQ